MNGIWSTWPARGTGNLSQPSSLHGFQHQLQRAVFTFQPSLYRFHHFNHTVLYIVCFAAQSRVLRRAICKCWWLDLAHNYIPVFIVHTLKQPCSASRTLDHEFVAFRLSCVVCMVLIMAIIVNYLRYSRLLNRLRIVSLQSYVSLFMHTLCIWYNEEAIYA